MKLVKLEARGSEIYKRSSSVLCFPSLFCLASFLHKSAFTFTVRVWASGRISSESFRKILLIKLVLPVVQPHIGFETPGLLLSTTFRGLMATSPLQRLDTLPELQLDLDTDMNYFARFVELLMTLIFPLITRPTHLATSNAI